jgi:hypothetical protein
MMISFSTPLSCTTTKIEEERMPEVPPPTLDREERLYASLLKTTSTIVIFLIPSFL